MNAMEEFVMLDVYKALGWQGGTIHQVIAEIKRLKNIEQSAKELIKNNANMDSFDTLEQSLKPTNK
jgi:hypothetical protein